MSKRWAFAALLMAVALSGCGVTSESVDSAYDRVFGTQPEGLEGLRRSTGSWAASPFEDHGLTGIAYTEGQRFVLQTASGDQEYIPGVNLGATIPGRWPGELALSAEDYRGWFPMMTALGFRAVRIYTIHPPAFYEELAAYNEANPEHPLYLFHGIWLPDDEFIETEDLFALRGGMKAEIDDAVGAATGGNHTIARLPGHAYGTYTADVTPWIAGWLVGSELDPVTTRDFEVEGPDVPNFDGQYFGNTPGAAKSTVFFAEILDHLAAGLAQHGNTAPLAFVNWPTLDPLEHTSELQLAEDLIGVDANEIEPTDRWPGGYFASYHVYPYFPDLIEYEPGLFDFEHRGQVDPFAGYLSALVNHHARIPTMVTEYGVPSSIGRSHFGPLDRHQGGNAEWEAMAQTAELSTIIPELGFAGGFVFEWLDEWFKPTWNTRDFELPSDRRAIWLNALSPESNFGILAAVPGDGQPIIIVDGNGSDWDRQTTSIAATNGATVRMTHDAAFLYLSVQQPGLVPSDLSIGFDLVAGTNGGIPDTSNAGLDADVTLSLAEPARVSIAAWNDVADVHVGANLGYFDVDADAIVPGSGAWRPYRQLTDRPQTLPDGSPLAAVTYETGLLVEGTSDPDDPEFDSRTAWSASDGTVEIRLPWAMVGFGDPSTKSVLVATPGKPVSTARVDGVGITVAIAGQEIAAGEYSWEDWTTIEWHTRPKQGVEILAGAVWSLTDE